MSNLDHDIREALRLGYGVRYGKYKADHPHGTAPEQEDGPPEGTAKCRNCGELFVPRRPDQIYCCEECRAQRSSRNSAQRRKCR